MKTITITYLLSTAGQRANLVAGGSGAQKQTFTLAPTPALVERAEIDREGNASIDLRVRYARTLAATGYSSREDVLHDAPAPSDPLAAETWVLEQIAATIAAEAAYDTLRRERDAATERDAAEQRERAIAAWLDDMCGGARVASDGCVVIHDSCRHASIVVDTDDPRIEEVRAKVERVRAAKEAAEAAVAAAQKAQVEEAAAWIAAHGTTRLQKCVAAGAKYQSLYQTERLAYEYGPTAEWDNFVAEDEPIAPDEPVLDAFAEIKKAHPEARLTRLREQGDREKGWITAAVIVSPAWELNGDDVVIPLVEAITDDSNDE